MDLQEVHLSRWEKEKDYIGEKIRKFQKDLCDHLGEEEGNKVLDEGKILSEEESETQRTNKNKKVERDIQEGKELLERLGKKKKP